MNAQPYITLAVADGHQQSHTMKFLARTDLKLEGYDETLATRRPKANLPGVEVKVIRPQDMPAQVASGAFDLAVTGRDWLQDHLARFPESPVVELVDLGFGRVTVTAVVHNDLGANNIREFKALADRGALPFPYVRIASEYTNLADKYAQECHFRRYRIIPTWGATEAFLPEDADLIIENVETGGTLRRNNLSAIDGLMISTGCLIANKNTLSDPARRDLIETIRTDFESAAACAA